MSAIILIDFLSPECLPIMVKGASFIKGLFVEPFSVTGAATLLSFNNYYFNS